ncbi:MAG: hypothetical protein H7144_00525 [Burkholderiales bacterium]|nr:hypothetical protein [Phycisphaerae bacterium]
MNLRFGSRSCVLAFAVAALFNTPLYAAAEAPGELCAECAANAPKLTARDLQRDLQIRQLVPAQVKAKIELDEASIQLAAVEAMVADDKTVPQVEALVRADPTVTKAQAAFDKSKDEYEVMVSRDGANGAAVKSIQRARDSARGTLADAIGIAKKTHLSQFLDSQRAQVASLKARHEAISEQLARITAEQEAGKKTAEVPITARLRGNMTKLENLSPEQKAKIDERLAKLASDARELEKQSESDIAAILTDEQKAGLKKLQ